MERDQVSLISTPLSSLLQVPVDDIVVLIFLTLLTVLKIISTASKFDITTNSLLDTYFNVQDLKSKC